MKNRLLFFLLVLFLFFIPLKNTAAEEYNFGWSLGNLGVYYDFSQNRFNSDIELLHFNWLLKERLILGFSALNFQDFFRYNETSYGMLLPLEIAYIPLAFNLNDNHQLALSIYGKGGWEIISDNVNRDEPFKSNGLNASVGSQLFLQYRLPNSRQPYSRYLSLFADYSFNNGFKFGINFDISFPVILWLVSSVIWYTGPIENN